MKDTYVFKSPIGILQICGENDGITKVSLQQRENELLNGFQHHSDLLYEAYKQINEYFSGKRRSFELPVRCCGTDFQQAVWRELGNIPYGETRSYEDIAINIGKPKAARAIGQANNKNPVMIIVPCHRVINKNGDLGGFGCGTNIKKYLLDLEKGMR